MAKSNALNFYSLFAGEAWDVTTSQRTQLQLLRGTAGPAARLHHWQRRELLLLQRAKLDEQYMKLFNFAAGRGRAVDAVQKDAPNIYLFHSAEISVL